MLSKCFGGAFAIDSFVMPSSAASILFASSLPTSAVRSES
jgi:hypothetical protein